MKKWLLVLLLLGSPVWLSANTGYVVRATALKSAPKLSASTLVNLPADTQITLGERQGGWYPANYGSAKGWLRLTDVKFTANYTKGSSGIGQTINVLSGKTSPTMATGVKGLDEESIHNAKPNYTQVDSLDNLAVDSQQATQFARQGGLQ